MDAETLVGMWLRHRQVTQQLARVMPAEHFGFKAWEGGQSYGDLLVHIVNAAGRQLDTAEGKEPGSTSQGELPATPEAIRAWVDEQTARQTERLRTVADDPNRTVSSRGAPLPLQVFLAQMREHEAHHKGQLMMMARMCGVRDELFYVAR